MPEENRVVLKQMVGQSQGVTKVKNNFRIFVEGPEVRRRRNVEREHIGFVNKKPGCPINYLPVAYAFSDLLDEFTLQVRAALIDYHKGLVEEAKNQLSRAEVLPDDNPITAQLRDDAIAHARESLEKTEAILLTESDSTRQDARPTKEGIQAFLSDQKKIAEKAASQSMIDTEANAQNL